MKEAYGDDTMPSTAENVAQEFQISRSFPFSATLSFQAAESKLLDEMVTNLTDDIFNRLFSNW